jgi:hypothetical protein
VLEVAVGDRVVVTGRVVSVDAGLMAVVETPSGLGCLVPVQVLRRRVPGRCADCPVLAADEVVGGLA